MANLEPAVAGPPGTFARHPLGIAACAFGVAAVVVSAIFLWAGAPLDAAPDYRFLGPISGLAGVLAVLSVVRREPGWGFPAVAVCLAAAALVLGWVVVLGAIALGTALVIGILSYLL